MMRSPVWILLRVPFSVFLLPVALLGLWVAGDLDPYRTVLILVVLHLFLYPASNAFNSWYDKDSGSIGGVKNPPQPTKSLLVWALVLDGVGLVISLFVGPGFALGILVYGVFSKLYSWDRTRWKAKPFVSLIGVSAVQGAFTAVLTALYAGKIFVEGPAALDLLSRPELWLAAFLAFVFLLAVYPVTQIYQHEEDAAHGDLSYSRYVGVRGTFVHSAIAFLATGLCFAILYFLHYADAPAHALVSLASLAVFLAPALVFYASWWFSSRKRPEIVDFRHTMLINILASVGMNCHFLLQLTLLRHYIG